MFVSASSTARGGCGKTTVSTHLAAGLAVADFKTLLVDLDRLSGTSLWHKIRPKTAAKIALSRWRTNFGLVPDKTERVIIDCPASLRTPNVMKVIVESDLIIVPLLPSLFDQHATKLFLKRLLTIKKVRKGGKAIFLAITAT